ncbi:TonB-dependent receptor domain-containing protein [Coralloluteibacterium thermophilus]|uniref:TonB-dependent receptor domain-containing protein n=1 Tax=Coralloluteibacterium thermophilum TaxID=2707049 RepID=A0ABV9NJQ7_9GAMM
MPLSLPRRAPLALALLSVCLSSTAAAEPLAPRTLPEIVVTATATERPVEGVPASVTVITREELERRPIEDLTDALRGTPGVSLTGIGFGRRGVRLRGMSSDDTLTLVDGRRITPSGGAIAHSDFDMGWVPVEAIERIEVVRGPMSSLYGSEALGGVVNVITRSATDAWRGSVTAGGSVRDDGRGGETHQIGAYAGGPLIPGVLGLTVHAEDRRRAETPDAADPLVSAQEGRAARSGRIGLRWTPSAAQRVDLDVMESREDRWRDALQAGGAPYHYRYADDIERRQVALSHQGGWQWGDTLLRAYRTDLDRVNARSRGTPTGAQHLREDTVDGHASLRLGAAHRVSLGGEWRREQLDDPTVNAAGHAAIVHRALFLQDEIELTPTLSGVVGARIDDHEDFGIHRSPRAYLVQQLGAGWTLKGGYGRGFKAPSLKQLSPGYRATGGGGMFTIVGNPDLAPETNATWEFGTEYRHGDWSLQATAFQNTLHDLVQTLCVSDCGIRGREQRTYVNVDEARIRGLELAVGVPLAETLRLDANYTRLHTLDRANDRPLAERPRHGGALGLSWAPADRFDARLRGEYVGSQVQYSGANTVGLPAYLLWSADLRYRFSPWLSLRAGVENITDEQRGEEAAIHPYPESGRSYSLGLTVSF